MCSQSESSSVQIILSLSIIYLTISSSAFHETEIPFSNKLWRCLSKESQEENQIFHKVSNRMHAMWVFLSGLSNKTWVTAKAYKSFNNYSSRKGHHLHHDQERDSLVSPYFSQREIRGKSQNVGHCDCLRHCIFRSLGVPGQSRFEVMMVGTLSSRMTDVY